MNALPASMVKAYRDAEKEVAISSELVKAQNITCSRESAIYLHSQHEANTAESEMEQYADIIGDLRKIAEIEVAKKRKNARKGEKKEVDAAKRLEERQRQKVSPSNVLASPPPPLLSPLSPRQTEDYREKLAQSEALAKSQRDVARESHKIAAERVKTTTAVAHASKQVSFTAIQRRLRRHSPRL